MSFNPFYVEQSSIILLKNVPFKDSNRIYEFNQRRPYLVISVTEEDIYFLSMSTRSKNKNIQEINTHAEVSLYNKVSLVNLKNLYKKPLFAYPIIGNIEKRQLEYVLKSFELYQANIKKDILYNEYLTLFENNSKVLTKKTKS